MGRGKLKNTQQLLLYTFPNLLKFIEDPIGRYIKVSAARTKKFYQFLPWAWLNTTKYHQTQVGKQQLLS